MEVNNKTVEFKKNYTRGIDRDYNEILTLGLTIKIPEVDINGNVIPEKEIDSKFLVNSNKANDFLVMKMTNLTKDEIDDISTDEFNAIITEINKIKENRNPTNT